MKTLMENETDLPKMSDCFSPGSGVYWGERGEWIVAATVHRDADCLSRSNWRVMLKQLGGASGDVQIERASCSMVGWVDRLLVNPARADLVKMVSEAVAKLDDYPVLDEDDFCELEQEEYYEFFIRDASGEFARALRHEEFSERICDFVESAPAEHLIEWFEKQIPSGDVQNDGYPNFSLAFDRVGRDEVADLVRSIRKQKHSVTKP